MTISLSPLQQKAAQRVISWYEACVARVPNTSQTFYLAGFAGTGKTSIAKHLVSQLFQSSENEEENKYENEDGEINTPYHFSAYTGKAALVLRKKGCSPSSTIHSLIYNCEIDPSTDKVSISLKDYLRSSLKLIILDECSMVNNEMARDLLSFNRPILVLGDPGQLPPIEGEGFFTAKTPDFFLSEIHRQAAQSPILLAATAAREGRKIISAQEHNTNETYVKRYFTVSVAELVSVDQVLCGTNARRTQINTILRQAHNFIPRTISASDDLLPKPNEKLICLKNSRRAPDLVNGSLWKVLEISSIPDYKTGKSWQGKMVYHRDRIRLTISPWEENSTARYEIISHKHFFDPSYPKPSNPLEWEGLDVFDYGYCITVHKAQGSEWDSIFLFDESSKFRDNKDKWLYTAITRASKKLAIAV